MCCCAYVSNPTLRTSICRRLCALDEWDDAFAEHAELPVGVASRARSCLSEDARAHASGRLLDGAWRHARCNSRRR